MWGSVWEALGEFAEHFWNVLAEALGIKKRGKPFMFKVCCRIRGGGWGGLAILAAASGDIGSKMALCG